MKKWRGSAGAKLAAWVGITLCAVIFLVSGFGALMIEEAGVYDYVSADACREALYENVVSNYAVRALNNKDYETNNTFFDTDNFRYGIIKAENIDKINLNNQKIYEKTNFTNDMDVDWDEAYKLKFEQDRESGIYYSQETTVYLYETATEDSNEDTDIAGAEEATEIALTESDMQAGERIENAEVTEEETEPVEREAATVHIESADTSENEETTYIIENDDTTYIAESPELSEKSSTETYWVIVEKPEHVGLGISSDLFVQANTLATVGYALRYAVYVIMFVAFVLGVACFVFLMNAAGHRRDTKEIVTTWIDRMPLDVYLGFAFLVYEMLFLCLREASYYSDFPSAMMFFALLIVAGWVTLLNLLTFAVRVKCGGWWRNTVIWAVGNTIWQVLKTIISNIGLLWKAILAVGLLSVVEFYVVSWDGIGRIATFWLIEKIIFVPLFLLAIVQMQKLKAGAEHMAEGDLEHPIDTDKMFWEFRWHGEALNDISTGISRAVDERMKSERFKTELITNVSHDIKTPLTSIINYVDLLEKEELQNEKAEEYLEVLERQSARLKRLIEDLMEASKASTGNLAVHLERLEAGISLVQIAGEFEEKMQAGELELMIEKPQEPVYIQADSRHFWRVVDNLMNNICKYAQPGTRVYINLEQKETVAELTLRNTSKYPLNISSEELLERFVRGDSSRNTEGSGLGLSIAQSLMELMGGKFMLCVDGDLFKVVLELPLSNETE